MTRSGATIALHFQVIVYLLEAPRTAKDLENAFLITPERAHHYINAALYAKLISHTPGDIYHDPSIKSGPGRRIYRPVRALQPITKETQP